jgi:hypothetical protein
MYEVVISWKATGRTVRKRFPSRDRATAWRDQIENAAMRFPAGLRAIVVEVNAVATVAAAA